MHPNSPLTSCVRVGFLMLSARVWPAAFSLVGHQGTVQCSMMPLMLYTDPKSQGMVFSDCATPLPRPSWILGSRLSKHGLWFFFHNTLLEQHAVVSIARMNNAKVKSPVVSPVMVCFLDVRGCRLHSRLVSLKPSP
jgi:hypothetical protein